MNIMLADNHELFRIGISTILEEMFPHCHITQCDSWVAVEKYLLNYSNKFDLILIDIFMLNHKSWHQSLNDMIDIHQDTPVCVLSTHTEQDLLQQAIDTGINGYICKTDDINSIKTAIKKVSHGQVHYPVQLWQQVTQESHPFLTQRQQEIIRLIESGYSNKLISQKLDLTENTVKRHVYNICERLNAKNRTEAVKLARIS